MVNHSDILEYILDLRTNNDHIKKECKELFVYKELEEKGVPYNIYLYLYSYNNDNMFCNSCYLSLSNSSLLSDNHLKWCFKKLMDFILCQEKIYKSVSSEGCLSYSCCRKTSVTEAAAIEASNDIKTFMNTEKYLQLLKYSNGYFPSVTDIKCLSRNLRQNECIYQVCCLPDPSSSNRFELSFTHNAGSGTAGKIIIGIPFEIN